MLSARILGSGSGAGSVSARVAGPSSLMRAFHASPWRGVVHHVRTTDEFKKVVGEGGVVVVDCFATWCGPCRMIGPLVEKHSEDKTFKDKIHFVKIDVDELPDVTAGLGVKAMPTFVFFRDGKRVGEMVGADPQSLVERLKKMAA